MSVDADNLEGLRAAIVSGDPARIVDLLDALGEEDERPADLLIELSQAELRQLATVLGDEIAGDVLGDLDPEDAADLLERLRVQDAADVLEMMDPDDAADIVGEILPDAAADILTAMEPDEAEELRELLAYPTDTAGGRMTPAFVSVSPDLRADQTVVALRRVAQEAETVNYVYVTDAEEHLLGVLSLHNLVLTPPDTRVRDLMVRDVTRVAAMSDQEEAARLLNEHDLLAIPVVDDDNHLLGIITADDVADILEQETTEDIERLGGSQPLEESYLRARPTLLWRRRVIWLLVLFFAGAYTSTVLRFFQDDLEAVVALSFFIPLLIGTGGNVGSQVVTTIVRAMAIGDVRFSDTLRVVRKEIVTGVMLGAVMSSAMFARALMMGVGYDVSIVVAVTVIVIVVWAAVVAAALPIMLRQLKVDPAVVSAPFITTLVDGTGLLIYFSVARLVLESI